MSPASPSPASTRHSTALTIALLLTACSCADAPSTPQSKHAFADPPAAGAGQARTTEDEGHLHAQAEAEMAAAQPIKAKFAAGLYTGALREGVADMIAYAEQGGAARRFVVGNMLWSVAPAASEQLHRNADELLPDQPEIVYELALHYTRNDDCVRALPLWKRIHRAAGLPAKATYIAAYCYLATGDERGAYDLVTQSKVQDSHTAAERLSYEVFGGPEYAELHDADYRKAAAGDRVAMDRALGRAFDWRTDWWNHAPNAHAYDALRALMARQSSPQQRQRAEWECLWPQLTGATRDLTFADLKRCGVLVEGQPYPVSSALGLIVIGRLSDEAANGLNLSEFHARHAATLRERAFSAAGDLEALRVLAYMQQALRDEDGLRQSDELGWKRYRDETFARSRIERAHPARGERPDVAYLSLLRDAMRDFPQVPRFILIDAVYRHPDGELPVADLSRLLRAETRSLLLSTGNGSARSSSQLQVMYKRLGRALGVAPQATP